MRPRQASADGHMIVRRAHRPGRDAARPTDSNPYSMWAASTVSLPVTAGPALSPLPPSWRSVSARPLQLDRLDSTADNLNSTARILGKPNLTTS